MKYLKRIILMIQFLTRIPIKTTLDVTEEDFGKGLAFAPFVGLVIGVVLYLIYLVFKNTFPVYLISTVIVVCYLMLSGGIHMDGLGDTFDGVFSGRSKEKVMEIMKDSRTGTFGVLALISIILLDVSLLSMLIPLCDGTIIIIFPILGRMGCLIGAGAFDYARKEGLAKSFVHHCSKNEIMIGLIITLVSVVLVMTSFNILIHVAISLIISYLLNLYFSKKLSGITGDTMGAVCELSQTIFLLIVALF
jgi:adenosylcobinamide-GDP ribazoletransferase